jgi:hypothetical protein
MWKFSISMFCRKKYNFKKFYSMTSSKVNLEEKEMHTYLGEVLARGAG